MKQDEIHTWITKSITGELSAREAAMLKEMLQEDPELMEAYTMYEKLWTASALPEGSLPDPEVAQAWAKFEEKTFAQAEIVPIRKKWNWITGVAAAVLLVLAGGIVWFNLPDPTPVLVEHTADAQSQVDLPDGSVITLDAGSTVQYEEGFMPRKIALKGRAFFDVAHLQMNDPFTISSGATEVVVLGTSFSVDARKPDVIVSVKTGRVSFSHPKSNQQLLLTAGESAHYYADSVMFSEVQTVSENTYAWQTGRLLFTDTPLQEVLQSLETFYAVTFETEQPEILDCRFKAIFESESLENVLEELGFALNLEFESTNDSTYLVRGKGCH